MNKLQNAFARVLPTVLIAALISSCSGEAKKARLARRADEFFKAGEYEKAKIEYTNLLRADPKDPMPYERIGLMWLEEGAPLRAGPFFFRAKELAPARAEIKTKLAEIYIAVGGIPEARTEATEALQLEPGNETAILILADAARTPEEIAEAERHLQSSKRSDTVNYHLASATLALRKNNVAALEPALLKAVEADPKSAQAHLGLARYRLASRNNDAARDEFKLAADLAPLRSSAHLLFAEFKAQTGARDEAIAHLHGVVKKAPDFLPAWTLLAKYAAQTNYDEAVGILENVFRRDPQNFDARMLESEFYIAKGDTNKAIEALKQLESNYPKIPIIKYQLARALLQTGDSGQAVTVLEQAIALAPDYGDALLLVAEINLRNGNPAPVVGAMENFLKTTPNSDRAQVMLADAYRATGRFDDAAAILRQQIAATPEKSEPYLLLGVLLRQQNKNDEARATLEKAAELSPDKLAAVNQLIELDIVANDYPTALRRVTELLAKTPDSAGLHLLQGKIYAAQREWDRAEAALLNVLHLNANFPSAYQMLVAVYIAKKNLPEAVAQLEAFLVKGPKNTGALMTLALIHNEMKDFEKARDAYERLLAIKPDNAMAANNLAYIYSDHLNELDKALDWAGKARSADPGNALIADTFGWILYRQGDYKQAASLLKEAAGKMPNEPEIQYHLGMAGYMMGDSKTARVALEAATLSPKEFSGKEEARRRLAMLDGAAGSVGGESVEQLEALLKEQPNDPVALVKLAEAYETQEAFAKSASTYERAIKINPTLANATLRLAQLYAGPLQNKERALELAKKARDLAPGDAQSAAILGRLASQAGNHVWAYSLLQESSRKLGNEPAILKDFAWAAYSIGKVAEARQTMERVSKAAPDSPESREAATFLSLTSPEMSDADAAAAEAEAQRALKEDPANVPAIMVQARLQTTRGETKAAIATYGEVVGRFPEFAPAQKQLAALYLDDPANRLKAHELATSARKTTPDDPELAAILGEASYHKKEYSRASQLLQESNRKIPLNARRLYYLGMSLLEGRQASQGREILERAVSGGLSEPLASEADKALKSLAEKQD